MGDIEGDSLLDLVRREAVEAVPASLEGCFANDCEEIAASIQKRVEMIRVHCPDQKVDMVSEISWSLKKWVETKLIVFAYGWYKKLMEEHGKKPKVFKQFTISRQHDPKSTMDRFLNYEREGKEIGSKYRRYRIDLGRIDDFTVQGLTADCLYTVKSDTDGLVLTGMTLWNGAEDDEKD